MISVRVFGKPQLVRFLNGMARSLKNVEPQLKQARDEYFHHVQDIFATEGSAGSGPWRPLSPKRVSIRGASDPAHADHPILFWTGDLFRAAATPGDFVGDKVSGGQTFSPNSAEWWVDGAKALNNDGQPTLRLPKREFWPLNQKQEAIILEPFERWLDSWTR